MNTDGHLLSRRALLSLAALAALGRAARGAGEERPPPETWAQVTLMALGYLRSLERFQRAGGVSVLCLHADDLTSRSYTNDVASALRSVGQAKPVGGAHKVTRAEARAWAGGDDLRARLEEGWTCVFVGPGLAGAVEALVAVTRRAKALSLAAESGRARAGVAFAAVLVDRRPQLFINRPAAEAEGAAFQPALLRRAQVFE